MQIDKTPFMKGGEPLVTTPNNFVKLANEQRKRVITAPDLYELGDSDDSVIKSLQTDFEEDVVVLNTRNRYNGKGYLKGAVIHNLNSRLVEPTEKRLVIPVMRGAYLVDVLGDGKGLAYIMARFGTKDKPRTISRKLHKISGKPTSETRVWTLEQEFRGGYPETAACLYYFDDGFHVFDYYFLANVGRSRGVLDVPVRAKKISAGKEVVTQNYTPNSGEITDKVLALNSLRATDRITRKDLLKAVKACYEK